MFVNARFLIKRIARTNRNGSKDGTGLNDSVTESSASTIGMHLKRRVRNRNFLTRFMSLGLHLIRFPRRIKNAQRVKKICVFHTNYLGDTILLTPVFRNLRAAFPKARIAVVCTSPYDILLSEDENIDDVIVSEMMSDQSTKRNSPAEIMRFVRELLREKYDVIFDYRVNICSLLLAMFSLFRSCWIDANYFAILDQIKVHLSVLKGLSPRQYCHEHASTKCLRLLNHCGIATPNTRAYVPFNRAWLEHLNSSVPELQRLDDGYFIICPGASWKERRWPVEKFARTAVEIKRQTGLIPVVCGGGKDELQLAGRFDQYAKIEFINLVGKLTLTQFVALISKTRLLLGNDSGPVHVAAALDRPVVAILGTCDIEMYRPRGKRVRVCYRPVECGPCYAGECYMGENRCIRPVTEQEVLEQALELLHVPHADDTSVVIGV